MFRSLIPMARIAGLVLLLASWAWGQTPVADQPQPKRNDSSDGPLPTGAVARMKAAPSSAQAGVCSITFSLDGKTLISRHADRLLCLWDAATGKLIRQVEETQWGRAVAFSPDGKTLAAARLWVVEPGGKFLQGKSLPEGVRCLAFSPDSQTVVLGCDDRTIRVWSVKTGEELQRWPTYPDWVYSLAFAPDGRTLAVGGCETLRLLEAATGKEIRDFHGHQGWHWVNSVAFTPDGKKLVSASSDGTIRLWDVASGKEKGQFRGPQAKIYSLALAPDGRTLASAGSDQIVRLWETVSLQTIQQFKGHQTEVLAVRFSPDGSKIASGSEDQTILVWDVQGADRSVTKIARPEDLERLWADLGGNDAIKAQKAIWTMIAQPEPAIAFLRQRLKPVQPIDPKLIADLDSDTFAIREKATEELERLGETAEATLRKALAGNPPLEVTRRIEGILDKLKDADSSLTWWRFVRSLQVIEHANVPEAQKLMESLASGMAEARWTQQAKGSLERMTKRLAHKP